MTPRDIADRAKQLLEDEVLQKALVDIRERIVRGIEGTAMEDVTAHHEAAISLQLLGSVNSQLRAYLEEQLIHDKQQEEANWIRKMTQRIRA